MKFSKLITLPSFLRLFFRYSHDHVVRPDIHIVTGERYNKGLAFTIKERQTLGIHGLWPCSYRDIEDQIVAVNANFDSRPDNMGRSTYLLSLSRRHQRLFYRFLREYTEKVLPIVYTPTVGDVVSTFGLLFRDPTGLYVTIFDRGHIVDVLRNWRANKQTVRAVCVSDGGRVLGLGDMGASSMGICVGKMALYTALGGVPPEQLLPVALDVGTDNEELLCDPFYVGARIRRVSGPEYEDLVQEFVEAVVECFGPDTCIHFEDFGTANALKFLKKYQHSYCCFNDDIQGTGAMGLAGFLNVERLVKRKVEDLVFLFAGAGSACLGVANMLITELKRRGISDPYRNIYLLNEFGIIHKSSKNCSDEAKEFAKPIEDCADLQTAVDLLKPSVLVGASSVGGLFTEEVLRSMGKYNERPAIFALSNPTSKSECTAEQAFTHTEGRAIFSAGSPFPPVVYDGKRLHSGQANNCLIYPGIALGAICARAKYLPNEIFSVAASTIAENTSKENLSSGNLYPLIKEANEISFKVGVNVAHYLLENDLSNLRPVPENICEYVKKYLYSLEYDAALPKTWPFPHFSTSKSTNLTYKK